MDWSFLISDKQQLNISTDTRNLPQGCVFFALHGASFDGNLFASDALAKGASLVVVDNTEVATALGDKAVLVEDTLRALQELARDWRRAMGIRVIGITGTNGKTTTKELTAAVLKTKYNLLYTQGNLNNAIGVPLTLLQLTREHDLALIEMGASHPGDIEELVNICEPDCGLITNVGKAHLLGFGSFEGVQATKKELYDYLAAHGGFIFRNVDNPYLEKMYTSSLACIPYHTGTMLPGTHLVGDYNSENIQAAICVGEYFGIDRATAEEAIRVYVPTNNRSQRMQTERNMLTVDAYNANVTSMTAAIEAFTGNMLILGDMLELGEYSEAEHQRMVDLIKERGFKDVYLVGDEFGKTDCDYLKFTGVEHLRLYLSLHPELEGKDILLKGSRGIHLEKILDLL